MKQIGMHFRSILLFCAFTFSSGIASTYRYFAIGSNMLPATMKSLRNIKPRNATAAVLVDYRLCFDIAGSPLFEPSAASVRPCKGCSVHGVLYDLTPDDFARVGLTEGLTYSWERCLVYPYVGDGKKAGEAATRRESQVECFTLTKNDFFAPGSRDIPSSPSYLQILQEGAAYWKMDRSYQVELSQVQTADNLLIKNGLSGTLLKLAEFLNPQKE